MKPLENLIPATVAQAVGAGLMHSLWQISALALVLAILLAWVPRRAAGLRYRIAIATMGLMLAVPVGTSYHLYDPSPASAPGSAPVPAASLAMASLPATPAAVPVAESPGRFTRMTRFFQEEAPLCMTVWLAGVALFSLRFIGGWLQVRRWRARSTPVVSGELPSTLQRLAGRMGIRRTVSLRTSPAIDTPLLIGVLKPVVLLPAGLLTGLSTAQVECILLHELAHVRRWDYLVNIAQSLAEILLFFHPAVWWVSRIIRQERENCCDEWVLRSGSDRVQYAHALLNLELLRNGQPGLAMASQGGDLASRIRRITGQAVPKDRRFHPRGLVYGLVALAIVVAMAAQTPTVVKAALPFLSMEGQDAGHPGGSTPQDEAGQSVPRHAPSGRTTAMQAAIALASSLKQAGMEVATLDSPVTRMILNYNGDEVVLQFRQGGEIVSATRNGKPVPPEDLAHYRAMAREFLGGTDIAPPPLPLGGADTLPHLPGIPPLPPMPVFPRLGSSASPEDDSTRHARDWEEYRRRWEEWGRNFSRQFESPEWQKFSKDADRWAGDLAIRVIGGEDTEEMKAIRKEMEALEKEMENTRGGKRSAEKEQELEELSRRLGALQSRSIQLRVGEFEEEMENLGMQIEVELEKFGNELEKAGKDVRRSVKVEIEHSREGADGSDDGSADESGDGSADGSGDGSADGSGDGSDHEKDRVGNAADHLGCALEEDGLIQPNASYSIQLNDKYLEVNSKRQSSDLHQKYLRIAKDQFGRKVGKESIIIERKVK